MQQAFGMPGPVQFELSNGTLASTGQNASVPVQASDGSHIPVDARQGVPPALKPSPGQASVLPVQNSCTSQLLAGATSRQSKVLGCFTSAGQAPLVPSQTSAASQKSTAGRHDVPTGSTTLNGQVLCVPSHTSATSQVP